MFHKFPFTVIIFNFMKALNRDGEHRESLWDLWKNFFVWIGVREAEFHEPKRKILKNVLKDGEYWLGKDVGWDDENGDGAR